MCVAKSASSRPLSKSRWGQTGGWLTLFKVGLEACLCGGEAFGDQASRKTSTILIHVAGHQRPACCSSAFSHDQQMYIHTHMKLRSFLSGHCRDYGSNRALGHIRR